jgi:hypothetical protein
LHHVHRDNRRIGPFEVRGPCPSVQSHRTMWGGDLRKWSEFRDKPRLPGR